MDSEKLSTTAARAIYKYTSADSAKLIIANRSLRFGRPTEMNDPFDAYIDDLFDQNVKETLERFSLQIIQLLENNPDGFANFFELSPIEATRFSYLIKSGSQSQKSNLLNIVKENIYSNSESHFSEYLKKLEIQKSELVSKFRDTGIFCATRRRDNLLMWAHYAESHSGVVLGFRPDIASDSFLQLLEPIEYSAKRPKFYDFVKLEGQRYPGEICMRAFNRSLTATKSLEWSYEEELRVAIPSFIDGSASHKLVEFRAHELTEIYFGLRIKKEDRQHLIGCVSSMNPDILIFQTSLVSGEFSLQFDRVFE